MHIEVFSCPLYLSGMKFNTHFAILLCYIWQNHDIGIMRRIKWNFQNGDTSHVTPNTIALTNKVIKVVPSYFCGGVYMHFIHACCWILISKFVQIRRLNQICKEYFPHKHNVLKDFYWYKNCNHFGALKSIWPWQNKNVQCCCYYILLMIETLSMMIFVKKQKTKDYKWFDPIICQFWNCFNSLCSPMSACLTCLVLVFVFW